MRDAVIVPAVRPAISRAGKSLLKHIKPQGITGVAGPAAARGTGRLERAMP